MDRNDGGPAFPLHHVTPRVASTDGMTLRDYATIKFAAAWVVALAARRSEPGYYDDGAAGEAMRLGTAQADAMLAERAKAQP